MAYVITTACIDRQDMACVEVCPVDCIHFEEGVDRKLYIDPVECIDCNACEAECPVMAIFADRDLPDDLSAYLKIDADWFSDKKKARQAVDQIVAA